MVENKEVQAEEKLTKINIDTHTRILLCVKRESTMNDKIECESCEGSKPADSWEQIGEPELHEGGRSGDTTYTHYRCTLCGSRWRKTKDSGGLGGNGTYYKRES